MSLFCIKRLTWFADNLIRLIFVDLPVMSDLRKGGIRKRVLQNEDAPPSAAASSSSGDTRQGYSATLECARDRSVPQALDPVASRFQRRMG